MTLIFDSRSCILRKKNRSVSVTIDPGNPIPARCRILRSYPIPFPAPTTLFRLKLLRALVHIDLKSSAPFPPADPSRLAFAFDLKLLASATKATITPPLSPLPTPLAHPSSPIPGALSSSQFVARAAATQPVLLQLLLDWRRFDSSFCW
jgi:hypothetical protein